jgi:hypothetical protein
VIKDVLALGGQNADLAAEKARLQAERREGIDQRNAWSDQQSKLTKCQQLLKDGDLQGVCVNGRRPTSSQSNIVSNGKEDHPRFQMTMPTDEDINPGAESDPTFIGNPHDDYITFQDDKPYSEVDFSDPFASTESNATSASGSREASIETSGPSREPSLSDILGALPSTITLPSLYGGITVELSILQRESLTFKDHIDRASLLAYLESLQQL